MRTYGAVSLLEEREVQKWQPRAKGKRWHVDAEPHVLMRIKRVFGKVDKGGINGVMFTDTPENARDLLWFLDRYPLDVPVAMRAQLQRQAEVHRTREDLVEQILSGRYASQPPRDLAIPLREYQKQARDIVLATGRLLLADDVGLGKTASSIGILVDPRALPAVVVTLTHLTKQWEAEINRFAPHLRVHEIEKGTPYDLTVAGRKRKARAAGQAALPGVEGTFPDVLVVNYAKIAGWGDALAPHVKSVIFDECQELRREDSDKYRGCKRIADAASFRMGLSATPFYNYGSEMHSVMECLSPDALGSHEEFIREWCAGHYANQKAAIKDPAAFGTHLRASGLMLRRTRAEVGREIPPVSIIEHAVDADLDAIDRVATSATELARILLAQTGYQNFDKMRAAGELDWKLRQATGIAKAPYVAEFVRLLLESGERVVLFGWHHEVYRIWQERLANFSPVLYTGQESTVQKEEAKRRFVSGETPLLIMSLRSGAGLDGLQQVCRTVVFGEIDWSPGVHEQNIGRVARDGQGDPVAAYFLLANAGSDPIVWDVLGIKGRQIEGVKNPDAPLVEALQVDPDRLKKLALAFLRQRGETPVAA